jgi:hypothetical protein
MTARPSSSSKPKKPTGVFCVCRWLLWAFAEKWHDLQEAGYNTKELYFHESPYCALPHAFCANLNN